MDNEFDASMDDETAASLFSPVSNLAMALSCQSLDTPRRRLSLDTNTSSGTPIDTPGRLALVCGNVTPDSMSPPETSSKGRLAPSIVLDLVEACTETNVDMSASSVMANGIARGQIIFTCEKQDNRISMTVPDLVLTSCHSSRSSSGSNAEDSRTPGVLASPATSPVFALDEDSRDSGYGGENTGAVVTRSAAQAADSGIFLHPLKKAATFQLCTKPNVMYDGEENEDAGIFDEAVLMDDENSLPSGCSGPIASLLREQIVYEGDKKLLTKSHIQDLYDGTPLKRKSQPSRRGPASDMSNSSVLPRHSPINDENDEDGLGNLEGLPEMKRRKSFAGSRFNSLRVPFKTVNRCHSETGALFSLAKDENCQLVGDHSGPHALPVIDRPHVNDLKCINSDTLRRLMNGEFNDAIGSFTLIDCRYPYEYEGGHIRGAINLYTKEQLIMEMLDDSLLHLTAGAAGDAKEPARRILVFYCEFSRERGPRMNRFLRNRDRKLNEHQYPKLFYPEIYLLDGGYKNFYSSCSDLCQPLGYRSMHDEDHISELRKFRSKSKSWCSGAAGDVNNANSATRRPGLNRGLFSSKGC